MSENKNADTYCLDSAGFPNLLATMTTLASAGSGDGHLELIKASFGWLETSRKFLSQKEVLEKLEMNVTFGKHQVIIESTSYILSYLSDVFEALKLLCNENSLLASPFDTEFGPDVDAEWIDDLACPDDDESAGEESDEDSLCNMLCTFTMTQREFMNQYWYHCHTCKMVDGVGVCTVCAKVCHKDHDVTFAKYGSFFCDCGAKQDASCLALTKRVPTNNLSEQAATYRLPAYSNPQDGADNSSSGSKRPPSSPVGEAETLDGHKRQSMPEYQMRHKILSRQLQSRKNDLLNLLSNHNVSVTILELLQFMLPSIMKKYQKCLSLGSSIKAKKALKDLHENLKNVKYCDNLMVPTLSSQEGAFDNVLLSYAGEQGQTIRDLISVSVIKRVAMCALFSPFGKKQHLAVSHEKGKITLYQLSSLLKQPTCLKKKFTLSRLGTAPIPFTVLSMASNPCNEDFLAVCGLRDCHVLTFNSSGNVSGHLLLHTQLEAGNYVIKSMWIPGTQVELALVTIDFVKIYDLSVDLSSPQYFFLLPSGKIRDVTFVITETSRRVMIISSTGHIYAQTLDDESSFKHGPFYVTNLVDLKHPEISETAEGSINSGGTSIYYSHTLQLLFLSFNNGISFIAPLTDVVSEITNLFPIELNSEAQGTSLNNASEEIPQSTANIPQSSQPLYLWSEIRGHPGLICAMAQQSNNPVIFMIKPDTILIQEIRLPNVKQKITDIIGLRHNSFFGELRTTLLLLCEDGGLRLYVASTKETNFWLRPSLLTPYNLGSSLHPVSLKGTKKKKVGKITKSITTNNTSNPSNGSVSFPIDFFEHCTLLTDIEFGGNDVLQVYNLQQLKDRLNSNRMYIASTKSGGFTINVTNNDPSMVIVGARVLVGSQDITKAPSYIQIFERPIYIHLTRNRWYDFPFTREESLLADKTLSIFFGPSGDPNSVTMVDSIKIYGKTKESFSWPEDGTENVPNISSLPYTFQNISDLEVISLALPYPQPITSLDRLLSCMLQVLEGTFSLKVAETTSEVNQKLRQATLGIVTELMIYPLPAVVQQKIKYLLLTLHQNRAAYNNHRDNTILNYVMSILTEANRMGELDGESFYRLMMVTKSIVIPRPENLIKLGECFVNTIVKAENGTNQTKDQKDSDATASQGCTDLSSGAKSEATTSKLKTGVTPSQRSVSFMDTSTEECHPAEAFLVYLSDTFWNLCPSLSKNSLLTSVASSGLVHVEGTVQSLVEIIISFALLDHNNLAVASQLLIRLFLCKNTVISFGAKQSLIRQLRPKTRKRKVFIPSPPLCEASSTGQQIEPRLSIVKSSNRSSTLANQGSQGSQNSQGSQGSSIDVYGQENLLQPQFDFIALPEQVVAAASGVDELMMNAAAPFAPLLDLNADADDDAMVELAIALSLQSQDVARARGIPIIDQAVSSTSNVNATPQRGASLEDRSQYSDTTTSAAASDDEGSTAATDGSALRISPVVNEPIPDGGGSESGASGVESIIGEHNVSGRSSAYGDESSVNASKLQVREIAEHGLDTNESEHFSTINQKLHNIRLYLLEKLVGNLSEIRGIGGIHCIPTMQVILMLCSDLDCSLEKDKNIFMSLLTALTNELHLSNGKQITQRTPENEVKLIIMRLLSILLSGIKSKNSSKTCSDSVFGPCPLLTAQALINADTLELCLQTLMCSKKYWKSFHADLNNSQTAYDQQYIYATSQAGTPTSTTLKPRNLMPTPDMSPFFMKQYVKGHTDDIFETYPHLLTEMVLKLPYQIKKISNSMNSSKQVNFSQVWLEVLCEYMMTQITSYVRKHVRKLLTFICGSKEKYRQIRDFHALEYHIGEIKKICKSGGFIDSPEFIGQGVIISLSYDSTIVLVEHLKACFDIASLRTLNWQKFCQDSSVLTFFFQASFLLDEAVAPTVLQLLQYAFCKPILIQNIRAPEGGIKVPITIIQGESSIPPTNQDADDNLKEQISLASQLAQQFISNLDKKLLHQFIQCFLLESNLSSLRMQSHSLLFNIYQSIEDQKQHRLLLDILWSLWDQVPNYGRKVGQFVDLLAYFTLRANLPEEKEIECCNKALNILRAQNKLLIDHPNSTLYNSLQNLVEFDGHYLESEPCLVCNNPEVNYTNMKLSSVKVDSRFTTTTQIVKLIGSHTISKIALRIADIKRSKMVKTLNIYYNNRAVHSVVELKNKTGIWHKAKKCQLFPGQAEIKIEFLLPITACNLMIEYGDFYENIQASSETLQCPRCSASVPANPGVCGNCGENVFQCHKCRAINYDEKDPFLCNSCGFSKYAKFDYTLTAKPTFSVDPIENEEDRKKTVQAINAQLEKADRVYKSLISNKPTLELLLLRIQEHGFMDKMSDEALGFPSTNSGCAGSNYASVSGSSSNVNRTIQQVAHKYCVECKSSFIELSKIIQKVLASRKELVDYDNIQRESISKTTGSLGKGATRRDSKIIVSLSSASGRCYGCASAVVKYCITLLNKLGTLTQYRKTLCTGLLQELVDYNLKTGSNVVRQEIRQLLCTLTLDNPTATDQLNDMLVFKIVASLVSPSAQRHDLTSNVRHEISLLICSLEREDSCWERRLRCLFLMFNISLSYTNPAVLESITLPCLKLLINLIKPDSPRSKKNKDKSLEQIATVESSGNHLSVDLDKWLAAEPDHCFDCWRKRCTKMVSSLSLVADKKKGQPQNWVHQVYILEKYGKKWRERVNRKKELKFDFNLHKNNWIRSVLFNKFSRTVRLMACSLVEALFQTQSRRKDLIVMLTGYLDELGSAGEYGQEFFSLYHNLIQQDHWKYYLALQGVLLHLGTLISKEIEKLNELEETTLNTDLSEGCALRMLVDLLTVFVEVPTIRKQFKSRLIAFILNGYLSLRKLVVQRTKIIDETQDNLLVLLEEMTTGTETETASFMAVCVEAVNKCKIDDPRTPVFIFERLCSIIYPEETDASEFSISLEKDPQQEDFLQGRMLGNPYPSNEPGMGPLMRDIKNKICQDCELIALLDDDSGMELLVCNKIISLDLPVKEVYKKVWLAEINESETMRIVYRMRGLMGDATEEFIQALDSQSNENVDNEQVYKMANVMSQCKGLEVMLQRLAIIKDLTGRSRPLLLVLLKLFDHCIKVRQNRLRLIDPSLKTIQVFLSTLKIAIVADANDLASSLGGGSSSTGKLNVLEMILTIMESILVEASKQPREEYDKFCGENCGTKEEIQFLLKGAQHLNVKNNLAVMQLLMRVIPLLTLGDKEKMLVLLEHFKPHLSFNKFDSEHTQENDFWIDCFCLMLQGIEKNDNGNRFKDLLLEQNIIKDALEYLKTNAPPVKSALLATSEEWKEFTQRPLLKYILRLLSGQCAGHPSSQMLVAKDSIPIIHGLEQVSSDSHVGSLAEILLDALKHNNSIVSEKIELVRKQTKEEKKRLAMAVRQKQLGELGMKANERGQVMAKSSILRGVEDFGEEQGLICIICREGYKFQPAKVLGIYTFTKKCLVEPFETKARKTMGYSTVTHFNVVHIDCHMAAVRHARGRDEWESAALQNANTKCNGLIPLWGPSVQESAFASCLARHNTYLHECTAHRGISYPFTIHDLKLLLLKFAAEESFCIDSGGGGPQSNIHLIPYIIHMALYVINTTRCQTRESKKIASAFLELPVTKWIENSMEAEGPYYYATMSLIINPPSFWRKHKLTFLMRLIVCQHARYQFPRDLSSSNHLDSNIEEYSVYKTGLIFWALIDSLYSVMFKSVPKSEEDKEVTCEAWTLALADYIRNNDQQMIENGDKILRYYEEELLPSSSFYDFCDIVQILHLIPSPANFLEDALKLFNN